MYTLNGIGTTLYGKCELDFHDKSYIATKWFVIFFLPIIPLGSYRVLRGETQAILFLPGAKTQYKMTRVNLNWKQVLSTYAVIWGLSILGIVLLFYLA